MGQASLFALPLTKDQIFQEVIRGNPDVSRLDLRERLRGRGFFAADDEEAKVRAAEDREVLRFARKKTWTNPDGTELELVNVVRKSSDGKKGEHRYVQIAFAGFEDLDYLVENRLKGSQTLRDEAVRFYGIGCRRFGKKFRALYDLKAPKATRPRE